MATIGVVGLGVMGLGIAQVFAQAGHAVRATDAVAGARASAPERLAAALERRVAAGRMARAEAEAVAARLGLAERPEELGPCDLIVEAVVEEAEAKAALLTVLEATQPAGAVLATNTSALSVTALAERLEAPERLVGLHFFNPAPAMRLVELVATRHAAPQALARARSLAEGAGKTVVACADRPGFVVNRVARAYYGEALAILEEGGASPGEIDAALVAAGYPLGPFSLIDLVGADINLAATRGVSDAMGGHPRYHVFAALEAQVARGDLGRKTGRGFVWPEPLPAPPSGATEMVARIEAALANEAGWLLAEGGTDAAGIDTALRLGLNFPRGPLETAHARGLADVAARLAALEAAAPARLAGRYAPAPLLAGA